MPRVHVPMPSDPKGFDRTLDPESLDRFVSAAFFCDGVGRIGLDRDVRFPLFRTPD